jgi:hypothetical protein
MNRCVITNPCKRGAIYKMGGSEKSLIPEFKWHGCGSKQGKAHFNDVPMFLFGNTILLMSVWTRDMVGNPNGSKK